MKVKTMTSSRGNKVPNQFIIEDRGATYFQSYAVIIVKKTSIITLLDSKYWNYTKTTGKYRNQFLGETIKETKAKIDNGTYLLVDLNS